MSIGTSSSKFSVTWVLEENEGIGLNFLSTMKCSIIINGNQKVFSNHREDRDREIPMSNSFVHYSNGGARPHN